MFTGISAGFLSLYPRGCSFPRFHGYIRGFSFPVPARLLFSALPRVYPRVFSPCTRAVAFFRLVSGIFVGNLSLYPRGGIFPAGHGYIRGKSSPVPARRRFSGWSRVYPREIFPCTRAAALFRPATGIYTKNLLLYPRGSSFPRFHGYIREFFLPVPARLLFSMLPRVYPRVFFPCTRAAALFHASTGIVIRVPPRLRRGPPCYVSAGFLFLYPRSDFLLVSSKKQKKINFFIKGEPLARFPILLHYNFVFSLILLIIPSSSPKS